jgi:putative tryptophan/tyrosine transport system substrate-binding protein
MWCRTVGVIVTLTLSILVAPLVADAQPTGKVYRIGRLAPSSPYVDAGGLMSYGPSLREQWLRTAIYVDKLLKGAKPVDLPGEQPTTFELVINLKTAQALALTISPSLLFRADEVVK